jgi:hypothetical protein
MGFGTLTTFDTLQSQAVANLSIAQFGEDRAFDAIEDALIAHNNLLRDSMADFVEPTNDRLRRYGGPDSMSMEELDEFGSADAQKITAGSNIGFPLKFFGIALQWTRLFFQNALASELAAQVTASQDADVKNIHRQLKLAIFNPVDYTFSDKRIDRVNLPVKALINADGAPIPIAPDGTIFDGTTHTHYLTTTSLSSTDLTALTETVIEHFLDGSVMVMINRAQEIGIRGMNGFTAYLDARLLAPTTALAAPYTALDPAQLTNRAIGVYGAAEVWVKPWIPAGYIVAVHQGSGDKALAMRTRPGSGDLELLYDFEEHPLRARSLGREFGFGVWNRVAAAVLQVGTSTYTAPVI